MAVRRGSSVRGLVVVVWLGSAAAVGAAVGGVACGPGRDGSGSVEEPSVARIVAQNDAWGRWQRLRLSTSTAQERTEAARQVLALDVPAGGSAVDDAAVPPAVFETVGPGPYVERGTELAVLSHEWSHGMRRMFRLLDAPGGDAILFSQLVALDADGRAHLTQVVGEIEVLRRGVHDGDIVAAEVYELDRQALARGRTALQPVERVAHLPAEGSNHFIAAFDPPVPIAEVPCRQCHADDHQTGRASLPTDDDPAPRRRGLLREHPALAAQEGDLDIGLAALLRDAGRAAPTTGARGHPRG